MSDHSATMKLLVSVEDAASMMGLSVGQFRRAVKAQCLPAPIKDGGLLRWRVSDLKEHKGRPVVVAMFPRRPRSVPLGPGTHHLYRHYDKEGRLLYVGISLSAIARLAEHKQQSHWFWKIARIEVTAYRTQAAARKAEMVSIKREKPLHNIVHAEKQA